MPPHFDPQISSKCWHGKSFSDAGAARSSTSLEIIIVWRIAGDDTHPAPPTPKTRILANG